MRATTLLGLASLCSLLLMQGGSASRADEESEFVNLFNGTTLEGWQQHGGAAKYDVENGMVVGTAVPGTPNSFLCTDRHYGDFILELEFNVDDGLNSGVQIRSHVYDDDTSVKTTTANGEVRAKRIPAGRVHGYQVEIDPSTRAWSGGIYDEGRRGWLYNLDGDERRTAREAFRQNEWNHYRIEAIGDSIKTWVNGVSAADLRDGMTPSGFIALQVHGVGDNPDRAGKQVRWRNIRIKEVSE